MTIFNPIPHQIFNEIDQHGLLLGLKRLKNERNPEFKKRILDVMVHRAGSTYLNLIYGITRELGLQIQDTLIINVLLDGNGIPLGGAAPAVVFQDTKCYLYSDYSDLTLLATLDRFDSTETFTLTQLKTDIEATGAFEVEILTNPNQRAMTLFNQSSANIVYQEDISDKGNKIKLAHSNLIFGTATIESPNLIVLANSATNLKSGEYFIDLQAGIIYSAQIPAPGSRIRYQYLSWENTFQSSPIIIHDLQSLDFKTKLFETVVNNNNETSLGKATILGGEIINELLSLYPTNYGK